jgi:sensor domain CHASE-containing protein
MPLKKEITLILLAVIGLFTVLDYTVQRFVIYPGYRELDRVEARADLQRGLRALQREIMHLDKLLHDWTAAGDHLRFMRMSDEIRIDSNSGPNAFLDNHLSVISLLDPEGRVIWERVYAPGDLSTPDLNGFPEKIFPSGRAWPGHRTAPESVSGILLTESGPMLVASRQIVDFEKNDPAAATLLLGRLLAREELAAIAAQTGVALNLWTCTSCGGGEKQMALDCGDHDCGWQGDRAPSKDDLRAIGNIDGENPISLREDGEGRLAAYALMPDLTGNGFLILKSGSGMPISAAGRDVWRGAMLSLFCVGLLILVVLLEALKFSVLKPLALLTRHAESLRRNEKHGGQISSILNSRNEIGVLAREFDSMVAQLALARQQLAEQSYYSGMTEMASGVIHNLRNALTPVTANLDLLKEEFRDLPLTQMKTAGIELAEGDPTVERREKLACYLRESLAYLAEIMTDVRVRLKNLDSGVARVERILSDQEKFIAGKRGGEDIDLPGWSGKPPSS